MTTSSIVRRLVCAQNDPGKERVRKLLIKLNDSQLQSGLGLTLEDIAALRGGTLRDRVALFVRRIAAPSGASASRPHLADQRAA